MSILPFLLMAAQTAKGSIAYVGSASASDGNAQTLTVSLSALTGGVDTAARAGDYVLVTWSVGGVADYGLAVSTSGYTKHDEAYSNDSWDTNAAIAGKFMGSTPDTSVTVSHDAGLNGSMVATVHVFRGVSTTSPLDVALVRATGTDTSRGNPGAITPVTTGAWIVVAVCAAAASNQEASPLAQSGSELSDFRSVARALGTTYTSFVASGYYAGWTTGSFDPAAFVGAPTLTSGSWVAFTVALRPA